MDRIAKEIELLRKDYPELIYQHPWVRIPRYALPADIWTATEVEVCFEITPGYPGQAPYGFYVNPAIMLKTGGKPDAYAPAQTTPFGVGWGKFSWQHEGWRATADLVTGSNLAGFVRTFRDRLLLAL